MRKNRTYTLNIDVVKDFENVCKQYGINKSAFIEMAMETFILKGNDMFSGILFNGKRACLN